MIYVAGVALCIASIYGIVHVIYFLVKGNHNDYI
jgi:hypothetical protein